MDLNEVVDRCLFHTEMTNRLGGVAEGSRRARPDDNMRNALRVFESACQIYDFAHPEILVTAARSAHARSRSGGIGGRLTGFAHHLCRELRPDPAVEEPLATNLGGAARLVVAVHDSLGDAEFARFVEAVDATIVSVDSEQTCTPAP